MKGWENADGLNIASFSAIFQRQTLQFPNGFHSLANNMILNTSYLTWNFETFISLQTIKRRSAYSFHGTFPGCTDMFRNDSNCYVHSLSRSSNHLHAICGTCAITPKLALAAEGGS
jgi:hypothetical protein